ncbi:MAG: ATP-binding protein, partial [Polyangiales bacterium]
YIYSVLKIGDPVSTYRQLFKDLEFFNRVGKFTILELTPSRLLFSYRSNFVERNLNFSLYRLHQLSSFIQIWGMPPARARILKCQVTQGEPESVYELTWKPLRPHLRLLWGTAVGLVVGVAMVALRSVSMDSVLLASALTGIGALAGATWQLRRRVAEQQSVLLEQAEDVGHSLETIREKYDDLQALNESLEDQVKQRTEELRQANVELVELGRAKNRFFSNISHELRTPLTLSIGPLRMVLQQEQDKLSEATTKSLRGVLKNQQRLLELINDLMALSKLEERREGLKCRPLDLSAYMRSHGNDFATSAQAKEIQTTLNVPDDSIEAYIDIKKLDKIFMNLLSNAYKFTPEGGSITIGLRQIGQAVEISVADTGIGIPEDKLAQVFARFSQVDDSATRRYEGTGIGLALVKDYAELHGGTVAVESTLGKGTCFRVVLPLGRDHLSDEQIVQDGPSGSLATLGWAVELRQDQADEEEPAVEAPKASIAGPKRVLTAQAMSRIQEAEKRVQEQSLILVVDDNPDLRRYLRELLGSEYRVATAVDGLDALEKARQLSPSLILSDVMMPRMSGDELCARLRQEEGALARTPVILITARADHAHKLRGLELGAADYLFKPFVPEELFLRVRNMLVARHFEHALLDAHAELSDDLDAAKLVQRAMLPDLCLPAPFAVGALFRPRDEVGGDIYYVQARQDGGLRLFVADATGHGVQGALQAGAVYREYAELTKSCASPGELLSKLNAQLHALYGGRVSFVGACVDFPPCSAAVSTFSYAQAGGLPLSLCGCDGSQVLPWTKGMVGGVLRRVVYRELEGSLGPDQALFIYSDGLGEQKNDAGETFDMILASAFCDVQTTATTPQQMLDILAQRYDTFRQLQSQQDDVTVLCVMLGASEAS